MTPAPASSSWHPVLPSSQLRPAENIVAGFLQGQEIALWRSAEGVAQAWENRCPHRGTRLTLGRILDGRLSCAYHGWEFEAGSGQCAVIPAQPRAAAPRGVCVNTYPVAEWGGMVWIGMQVDGLDPPQTAEPKAGNFLRSLSVRVTVEQAVRGLGEQGFQPREALVWQGELAGQKATIYLNAAQADWTFLHLFGESNPAVFAATRRLRSLIEGGAA